VPTVPALVLDPFVGTGTTVEEANRLGRRAVGVELSADFVKIASKRTAQGALFGANSVNSVNLVEKLPNAAAIDSYLGPGCSG
jgi:DNA modification methylase